MNDKTNLYSAAADSFERILAEHDVPDEVAEVMQKTAEAYQLLAACHDNDVIDIVGHILVNSGVLYETFMGYMRMAIDDLDLVHDVSGYDMDALRDGLLESMDHHLDVRTAETAQAYYRAALSQGGENKSVEQDDDSDAEWKAFTERQ